jgi:lipoprotein-anchoring transpeptidase ErfK/SrfK
MSASGILLPDGISRREFLKWGSLGFFGLFLPSGQISHLKTSASPLEEKPLPFGRVLEDTVQVFAEPSYKGKLVKIFWRDLVIPIAEATLGTGEPDYNRIWYRSGNDGYVHSGQIQPVQIQTQANGGSIPETGRLAEVTVPYTDTHRGPVAESPAAYRIYYGTTHWVFSQQQDEQGNFWYELYDDKYKINYFANARHLRLMSPEEMTPLSPEIPLDGKRLEVHLAEQVVIAYELGRPVFMTKAATGGKFSTGDYTTPIGHYVTNHKRSTRHMAAGDPAAPNSFDLPGIPWVSYFTKSGISFHGTYWHNDFGHPRSHGCVNLSIPAARWVFRWTLPTVPADVVDVFQDDGTGVDVL